MNDVVAAIANALRSISHPRMLVLMIWPMLVALVVWSGLAWWYWDTWQEWLNATVTQSFASQWLSQRSLELIARYSALLLMVLVLAPMVLITAVIIAAVVEMPMIVDFVATRDYPALEKRRGGTVLGSLANALLAVTVFAVLWVVTLPLWLTGVLAPVIAVLLSAYLNQRLFRYDALADHASADEYRAVLAATRGRLFLLGAVMGVLYFVPVVNLTVPVLSGLAFTHLCLAELTRLRQGPGVKGRG